MSKSDFAKKVIDACASLYTAADLVIRRIVIPFCIIKSNARPAIKLLTTFVCWNGASIVSVAIEEARKETYKMYSVE